jgi:dienelactone hydrolase
MKRLIGLVLLLLPAGVYAADESVGRQQRELQWLEKNLIPSLPAENGRITVSDRTWEQWIHRTGELPPDFAAMPSQPFLPDPLVLRENGRATPITTTEQWARQRQWMRGQFEHWMFGHMPPAPGNVRVASSREWSEDGIGLREVLLEFGPDHRARLHLKLMIPPGRGPFPVFLTNQSGDNYFSAAFHDDHSFWVRDAVRRGYIACYYQATDPGYGAPDDSDAYLDIYPQYDFSCLARWAWAASRAVDYLITRPEVIPTQIGITGHSRNGKEALLAAAFDDRIGAVVASSGLTGEALPFRYVSDPFSVEGLEMSTGADPHWFHPRLRFFSGREDKLPVDQNMLMALVAPRGLMLYSGYTEYSSNAFGSELAYKSVWGVYRFLHQENHVWLHLRPGDHNQTLDGDLENFLDFFDTVFGRRAFPKSETWIHDYDFERWRQVTGRKVDPLRFPAQKPGDFFRSDSGSSITDRAAWERKRPVLRDHLQWALGRTPPTLAVRLLPAIKDNTVPDRNPLELVMRRPQNNQVWFDKVAEGKMGICALPYAPGHAADLFYPLGPDGKRRPGKFPAVIWLHPYAYDEGWSSKEPWRPKQRDFILDDRPSFDELARRGFIVIAFDQIGFGGRSLDARQFYERYPESTLLGRMVDDTRAVVRAAAGLAEIDASRIYFLGYSLGAKVGLISAAMGAPVRGVAALCGVDPLRLHTPEKGTEGLRHYSHLHGLIPQLGFFLGQEDRVPFDYDEVLALAAPKQVLIVAPQFDRYARVDDVRQEVEAARGVYRLLGQDGALTLWTPPDFNRFPRSLQDRVFDYLQRSATTP